MNIGGLNESSLAVRERCSLEGLYCDGIVVFFFHGDACGMKKGVDMHLRRFDISLVQYCFSCRI